MIGAGGLTFLAPQNAKAYTLYSNGAVTVDLKTTLEYSTEYRVNDPSKIQLNEFNFNDGDSNLQHGFVANQLEVISALSITDGGYGVHISGEAYLDPTYLEKNQNDTALTINSNVSNHQNYATGTQNINGRNAELLDAFAYGSHTFDDQTVTLKVGRQTPLWGQSLFFTNNGIAAGQAPIDVNEALTLSNPQAQQVFLPVGQAVLTYQPTEWLTLQGYYQFEWRPNQFPGVGSYLSPVDFVGTGGDRLFVGVSEYFGRSNYVNPPAQNGQFGFSTQFQLGNFDLGPSFCRHKGKVMPNTGRLACRDPPHPGI